MTEYDDLLKSKRLARMRMGQEQAHMVTLPSTVGDETKVRVALVPLTEKEYHYGYSRAAEISTEDNFAGTHWRDRMLQVCNLWNACRDPQDLSKKAFSSPESIMENIEQSDIDYLVRQLATFSEDASPELGMLTDEEVEELKKVLEGIQWNALRGRQWAMLHDLILTFTPEQLVDSNSGFSSIEELTMTSTKEESIPTVVTS